MEISATYSIIFVALGLCSASFLLPMSTYGLFHLELNRLPGETGDNPQTEWLNMGYWKEDTRVFPEACRALALKLLSNMGYKGGRVLDVGHGTGESLILLLTEPSIPRPSHLTGITSLPIHYDRSRERVGKIPHESTILKLYPGDAVMRDDQTTAHPFRSDDRFDAILALDCAYHFRTRKQFLEQCYQRLNSSGRIGLADICFECRKTFPLVSLFRLFLPPENFVGPQEYMIDCMRSIGYSSVKLEDITQNVFPEFLSFLSSRGFVWKLFAFLLSMFIRITKARYYVVTAMKK